MDGNMAMILGIIAVVFVVVCVFLSFVRWDCGFPRCPAGCMCRWAHSSA